MKAFVFGKYKAIIKAVSILIVTIAGLFGYVLSEEEVQQVVETIAIVSIAIYAGYRAIKEMAKTEELGNEEN